VAVVKPATVIGSGKARRSHRISNVELPFAVVENTAGPRPATIRVATAKPSAEVTFLPSFGMMKRFIPPNSDSLKYICLIKLHDETIHSRVLSCNYLISGNNSPKYG
jgi:hypothetical protein